MKKLGLLSIALSSLIYGKSIDLTFVKEIKGSDIGLNEGFKYIVGLAVDEDENLYLSDYYGFSKGNDLNRIVKLNSNGKKVLENKSLPSPYALAFDTNRELNVADVYKKSLYKYDDSTNSVDLLISSSLGVAQGLSIDKDNNFYVADGRNHRILKYDAMGNLDLIIGEGLFSNIYYVAVNSKGIIYGSDYGDRNIKKFDKNGNLIKTLYGSRDGNFSRPLGMAIDDSDNLYVADLSDDNIEVFDKNDYYLGTFGQRGSGEKEFKAPRAIAFNKNGYIYASDEGNDRVQVLSISIIYPPRNLKIQVDGIDINKTKMAEELTLSFVYLGKENLNYQWYLANDALGSNKVAVNGATTQKYIPTSNDEGKFISFSITMETGDVINSDFIEIEKEEDEDNNTTENNTTTPIIDSPFVAYYPLDEIDVNTQTEEIIAGLDGDVVGTPAVKKSNFERAFKLNGSNGVEVENSSTLNFDADDFTIVSMIRTGVSKSGQTIVDSRDGDGKGYRLFLNEPSKNDATLAMEINGVNFSNPNSKVLNDNEWHCVAVSVDRDSAVVGNIYIDGEIVSTFDPRVVNESISNLAKTQIGLDNLNSANNFEGYIDEVGFSNIALDKATIDNYCEKPDANSSTTTKPKTGMPLIPIADPSDNEDVTIINPDNSSVNFDANITSILDLQTNSSLTLKKNELAELIILKSNVKNITLESSTNGTLFQKDGDRVSVKFTKSGNHSLTLEAIDLNGNPMVSTLNFNVTNSAPTALDAEFTISSKETLNFDLYSYFSDLDGENLTFEITSNVNEGTLQLNGNRVDFYPETQAYSDSFTIKATDSDGEQASANFTVNVTLEQSIELIEGWNLLGNSTDKELNSSSVLESDEVIYTFNNGNWNSTTSNELKIDSKEGFWLKVDMDRELDINPTDIDSTPKTSIVGWNLLAEREVKTLKELKFGFEKVYTYDEENSKWLDSTSNPNYELKTFQGYWGKKNFEEKVTCEVMMNSNEYEVKATFCSTSEAAIGLFWSKDSGNYDLPVSEKWNEHYILKEKHQYCGGFSKSVIENWDASSRCFEAHTYWGKK